MTETLLASRSAVRLVDGLEANFLVLDGDPLQKPGNFQRIALRVRAGRALQPPPRTDSSSASIGMGAQ